jgi:hypothetical protein
MGCKCPLFFPLHTTPISHDRRAKLLNAPPLGLQHLVQQADLYNSHLFNEAQRVLTNCDTLLNAYSHLAECIEQCPIELGDRAALMGELQQEKHEVARLIGVGGQAALRQVEKILGDGRDGQEDEDAEMNEYSKFFGQKRNGNADGADRETKRLKMSLHYAERGVGRMVKGLPEE